MPPSRVVEGGDVVQWRMCRRVPRLGVGRLSDRDHRAVDSKAQGGLEAEARRGGRGWGALPVVSLLFLILAGTESRAPRRIPGGRGAAAVGVGTLAITGRLRQTGTLVPRQEVRLP